jgi:hypothetical protein
LRPETADEIGQINVLIARLAGLGLGVGSPDLFTTLGRHRGLFRPTSSSPSLPA